jgi:hypothetical protein
MSKDARLRAFKAAACVRIPLEIQDQISLDNVNASASCRRCQVQHELSERQWNRAALL